MFCCFLGAAVAQALRKVGLWACLLPVLTLSTGLVPPSRTSLNLGGAQLPFADLERANLNGVNLRGADLHQALLMGAQLGGADLQEAELEYADLFEANLHGAHLQGANLRGAVLSNCNLFRADLRGARLEGAFLELARMGGADLTGASYDQNTSWPIGVDPVACGARLTEAAWTASKRRRSCFRLGRKARAAEFPTALPTPSTGGKRRPSLSADRTPFFGGNQAKAGL